MSFKFFLSCRHSRRIRRKGRDEERKKKQEEQENDCSLLDDTGLLHSSYKMKLQIISKWISKTFYNPDISLSKDRDAFPLFD